MVTIDGFGGTYRSVAAAIKAADRHNKQQQYPNKVTKIRDVGGNLIRQYKKTGTESYGGGPRDYTDVYGWVDVSAPKKTTQRKLSGAPTTKQIDGHTWSLTGQYTRKSKANSRAASDRRNGVPSRIFHSKKYGYMLYGDYNMKRSIKRSQKKASRLTRRK